MCIADKGIYNSSAFLAALVFLIERVEGGEAGAMGFCRRRGRMTRAFRGLARAWAGCGHQLHLAGSWMLQGVDRLDNSTRLI
jgi:hypothetical protein